MAMHKYENVLSDSLSLRSGSGLLLSLRYKNRRVGVCVFVSINTLHMV